ncbi:MAG TPA: SpoIIE family protein phosphatase [Polyangiaceae bacterium]|nr:SpoIIE family protein phosphatase [Polyangiaceae bacterium]
MILSAALAQRPRLSEVTCGDAAWIGEGDTPLVAVVDGLGHGKLAAEASQSFAAWIASHSDQPLDWLLEQGGRAIAHTRGVAASLVRFDLAHRRLWFAGVGNVELRAACRNRIAPISHPGILGRPLRRPPRVFESTIEPGDLMVLFSDGISSRVDVSSLTTLEPQEAANKVLREHGKDHDDATVVVLRCRPA